MAFAAYYQLLRALPALSWCLGLYVLLYQCDEGQTNIAVVINILQSTMTHVSDGGPDGSAEEDWRTTDCAPHY